MTEDDFLDGVLHWAELSEKRGHAGVFARSNAEKAIVEVSVAREFQCSLKEKFRVDISSVQHNEPDPPDIVACYHGRDIGIELTELVDGELLHEIAIARKNGTRLRAHNRELFQRAQWNPGRLEEQLNKTIQRKCKRAKESSEGLCSLVIYTAENLLDPNEVHNWLHDIKVAECPEIRSVFLLMFYSPSYREAHQCNQKKHWPLFKLYGSFWN